MESAPALPGTDGLFRQGGESIPFPVIDEDFELLLTETFRRLVLDAPVKASRLSEGFRERLLSLRHSGGFSVNCRHLSLNADPARLAQMDRYAVCLPVSMDRVYEDDDGQVLLDIPPDHRAGASVLSLDPMEWLKRRPIGFRRRAATWSGPSGVRVPREFRGRTGRCRRAAVKWTVDRLKPLSYGALSH